MTMAGQPLVGVELPSAPPVVRPVAAPLHRPKLPAIDDRAARLLDRVKAAEPEYRKVASVGGFDRMPFLIVLTGIVAIYGGGVLLVGRHSRVKPTILLVVLASAAVAVTPVLSNLD